MPTAGGLTAPSAHGGSLISTVAVPDGTSEYEVKTTLTLSTSGGTYVQYPRASPDALSGPAAQGTYYAVELQNPTFSGSACVATLAVYKRVGGIVTLPLLRAQGRGGSGVTFALNYNSQLWRRDPGGTWKLGRDVGYGFGWRLQAGSITPYWSDYWTIHHYLFTDSTGAEYRLDVNNNGVWTSREGIYLEYDSATHRLYFPDGTFWVMGAVSAGTEQDAGTRYPTVMQDTNGNQIYVRYHAGLGVPWADSSARINEIEDVRAVQLYNPVRYVTYAFTYNNDPIPHLTQIRNYIQTGESYDFTLISGQLVSPFTGGGPFGTVYFLDEVAFYGRRDLYYRFQYDAAGELKWLKLPYGAELTYAYREFSYVGSRTLREVYRRGLKASPGAPEQNWTIARDDAGDVGRTIHRYAQLQDPTGVSKVWWFEVDGPSWYRGLLTSNLRKHDTANYGPSFRWRGNLISTTGGPRTLYFWHDITGTPTQISEWEDGRDPLTVTVSPQTNYAAPSALTADNLNTSLNWTAFLGLASQIGPNSDTVAFSYDSFARPASATSPDGAVTTYSYDTLGRVTQVQHPDNSGVTSYVYEGNTVKVIDPAGKWKKYALDAFGNLVQVTEPNPAGGADHQTYYAYNLRNQLTQVQMPRDGSTQVRTFSYDTAGRLISETHPETGTTTYGYNEDGTRAFKQNARGQRIDYDYDQYRRLIQIRRPGETVTLSWGVNPSEGTAGRLAGWSNGFLEENFRYTASGRVTWKRQRVLVQGNWEEKTAVYSYDNEGRLTGASYPGAGPLSYTYDALGRLSGLREWIQWQSREVHWVREVTYNVAGLPVSLVRLYQRGDTPGEDEYVTEGWSYDARLQMTGHWVRRFSGEYLMAIGYSDPGSANNGRVSAMTVFDGVTSETVNFTYHALNRLVRGETVGPSGARLTPMMDLGTWWPRR